ncbi:unnamed protein product, partial [Discosporangium mesarthrocarpum]
MTILPYLSTYVQGAKFRLGSISPENEGTISAGANKSTVTFSGALDPSSDPDSTSSIAVVSYGHVAVFSTESASDGVGMVTGVNAWSSSGLGVTQLVSTMQISMPLRAGVGALQDRQHTEEGTYPQCSFWSEDRGVWHDSGMILEAVEVGDDDMATVSCQTNHLSTFSPLLGNSS